MLSFLPPLVRGVIAFVLLVVNTLFWCALLFAMSVVKLVLPFAPVRRRVDPVLNTIYGHQVIWSRGMRLASAGATVATGSPTGNLLFAVGPRELWVAGRAPFKVGDPATPQVYLTDPTTGLGMRTDSYFFKMRCNLAAAFPIPEAFALVEKLT
jgi:hypothetical protein